MTVAPVGLQLSWGAGRLFSVLLSQEGCARGAGSLRDSLCTLQRSRGEQEHRAWCLLLTGGPWRWDNGWGSLWMGMGTVATGELSGWKGVAAAQLGSQGLV